jgi:uncharacterized protein
LTPSSPSPYATNCSMKILEIDLQALPVGRSSFQADVPPPELDLVEEQYAFHDPLRVELDVVKGDREFVFSGWILAPATVECSRCLATFEDVVRAPFALTCHRMRGLRPEAEENGEGAVIRFIDPAAVRIDLADDVRAAVILALPIRPLCRPDCRGLCPRCGEDLNRGACGCPRPADSGGDGSAAGKRP